MRVREESLGFPLWVVDYDTFVAKVGGGGGVKFETKNELARGIKKGEKIFSWKKRQFNITIAFNLNTFMIPNITY